MKSLSVERVVALLTPIFAAAAGKLAIIGAGLGIQLNQTTTTAAFVTGATAAGAAGLTWLHGRSEWTKAEQAFEQRVEPVFHELTSTLGTVDPGIVPQVEAIVKREVGKLTGLVATRIPTSVGNTTPVDHAHEWAAFGDPGSTRTGPGACADARSCVSGHPSAAGRRRSDTC